MTPSAFAAPVVVLSADSADAADHARALSLPVLPCRSGRLLIDGLPSSPHARAIVLDVLGLDEAHLRWALALDAAEPTLTDLRHRVSAAAEQAETTLGSPPTLYALFSSPSAAEAALCP